MCQPIPAPDPGVYHDIPVETYFAWDAASNSGLSRLKRSPAHYRCGDELKTDAMSLGTAIHCAILEPPIFDLRYDVADSCAALTKDGRPCSRMGTVRTHSGWFCSQHSGGVESDASVLSPAEHETCLGITRAFHSHTSASAIYRASPFREVCLVWDDPLTGVRCKARVDLLATGLGIVADLKSTLDARRPAFERAIWKYGYHRQAAHYLAGAQELNRLGLLEERCDYFCFIPFEKTRPYAVATYRMDDAVIVAGRDQLAGLLLLHKACREANEWPAYPQEIQDIGLPAYAWREIEEETA